MAIRIFSALLAAALFLPRLSAAQECDQITYSQSSRNHYATEAEAYEACLAFPSYHHHEGPLQPDCCNVQSDHLFYIAYSGGPCNWNYGICEVDPTLNPDDPPGGDGGPDEIEIGDCKIDIKNLKKWLLSPDSFPFNIFYSIYGIISPAFQIAPAPPVINFEIPLDPESKNEWIPDRIPVRIDFAPFDPVAVLLRWIAALGMAWEFAQYGLSRMRNFSGVS